MPMIASYWYLTELRERSQKSLAMGCGMLGRLNGFGFIGFRVEASGLGSRSIGFRLQGQWGLGLGGGGGFRG